jgi:catechol 2,3-dioxygenase-like lactoylglutathione lyase family enzyme
MSKLIAGLAHINLLVPPGTFDQAEAFYAGTLGMTRVPVPVMQKDTLAWYSIPSYSFYPFTRTPFIVHPQT